MTTLPHPFIIGFSGRKNAGKDTCASVLTSHILETYGLSTDNPERLVKTYAFAGPLKHMCRQFYGLTEEQCYGTNEQKNSLTRIRWEDFPIPEIAAQHEGFMTSREVQQYVGTEIIRRMFPNAHVHATMFDICTDRPRIALVTDCRFSNEVAGIQELGGKVIRLTRVVYPEDNHESETALDPENYDWRNFDYILDNQNLDLVQQKIMLLTVIHQWGVCRSFR
jgi:hypothetical protein